LGAHEQLVLTGLTEETAQQNGHPDRAQAWLHPQIDRMSDRGSANTHPGYISKVGCVRRSGAKPMADQSPIPKLVLRPGTFHWDEHYLTNLPGIDAQHHGLVDIINKLGNLLFSSKINVEDIDDFYQQLKHYTE